MPKHIDFNDPRFASAAAEILMSAVVTGELLYGFRSGSRFERNARASALSWTIPTYPSYRWDP